MGFLHAWAAALIQAVAAVLLLLHLSSPAPVVTPQTATSTPTDQTSPTTSLPATSATPQAAKSAGAETAPPHTAEPATGTPAPTVATTVTPEQADQQTRAALVNILCTTGGGGYFNPISGSGVLVDNRGVILTNAHVAQYFLLRDFPTPGNVACLIRTDSPARAAYTAQLLYLPPAWVATNAQQVGKHDATGSGQNDYAFLRITGTTSGTPLPARFPSLTLTTDQPDVGEAVLLAAYPAELLGGATIQTDLYAASTLTQVGRLFGFTSTSTVELVSVGGTILSQEGSSGGAMVRLANDALQGIIATESVGTTTASRDLRAITLTHIDHSLAAAGQGGIAALLTGDIAQKAADFNAIMAPQETAQLEAALRAR